MIHRTTGALIATLVLAGALAFAGACSSDDNGDDARESASDLTATYENFSRDLLATSDIAQAPDDVKDGLKSDCGDLQDGIDDDQLDNYCDDLGNAIDDEDQSEFASLQGRVAEVKAAFDGEIRDRVADAADDNGDRPLEGGGDGDDDTIDNPLDDGNDDKGIDNPLDDDNDGDDSGN